MVHYGINKIKLASDEQHKIVILNLLTYLLTYLVTLASRMLASNSSMADDQQCR